MDLDAIKKLGTCPVCKKKTGSSVRPFVHLNVGCMKQTKFDGEPGVVMLSEAESKNYAALFNVSYQAGDPEQARRKPRRRSVYADVQFPYADAGQAEMNFCSLKCLRSWFNRLVDHVERESRVGASQRDPVYRITKFPATKRKRK
jgi:hypothetical protein